MELDRRTLLTAAGALALVGAPVIGAAQDTKQITLGITLEPPGLDPTAGAASAIAEITLYNIYETLTRIRPDGSIAPLLATSWEISKDLRIHTFHLRRNVRFHNGEAFNARTVAFSLTRAGSENSTNKDRAVFANIARIQTPDDATVILELKDSDPDLLFELGQATAIMVEAKSAPENRTQPVGTGPYRLQGWRKGSAITLVRAPGYHGAQAPHIDRAVFRFISDAAAQAATVLAGDVDAFPRAQVARSLSQFRRTPRFQVIESGSRAKTLLALNHRNKWLADVRVRRAIAAAIDRQAVIQGAADGLGVPIGSHYGPGMPGYIDTTGVNPYDPDRARALLREAGAPANLGFTLRLPPAPYARQGGEVIAGMLAKVGIEARLQNIEWAQWLSSVYGNHDFDMTIISHVEPLDLGNYAKPDYYWGYRSPAFDRIYSQIAHTAPGAARNKLLAEAQRLLATDVANVWLYQPQWLTVANARVRGLWQNMPIFVNELAALSWS